MPNTLQANGAQPPKPTDRIDNKIGYVLSNCLPCCEICNHMKHVLSYEDFLRHVNRIAEHRG